MIILLMVVGWYVSGVASFIFWWTRDYDLALGDAVFGLFVGAAGPFAWGIGWVVHGRSSKEIIVLRRRS